MTTASPLVLPTGQTLDPKVLREEARKETARRHFLNFVKYTFPDYHAGSVHKLLGWRLEKFEQQVRNRESPRLIIFLPPRSGKSELVSRRFGPWLLGRNPDWSIILASYGAELAEELSGDARRLVMSDEFGDLFGTKTALDPGEVVELERQRKSVAHWRIANHRGGFRAVGVGGACTGRGADCFIVDDPLKNRKEADSQLVRDDLWHWWQSTARTRLEPGGGIIWLQTPWHHDDGGQRLIQQMHDDPGADQWEIIRLPAVAEEDDPLGREPGEPLDPVRYDRAALDQIKATIGSREWAALYQCRPSPDEGTIFQRKWFTDNAYDADPEDAAGPIFQFWDTAHSRRKDADFSVCTTWRLERTGYRLLDRFKARVDFPTLKAEVENYFTEKKAAAVVIETVGSGHGAVLFEALKRETRLPLIPFKPDRDKVARAHAVTPLLESGRVWVPRKTPWLSDYLDQMCQFPSGEHDDDVDSTTMALLYMSGKAVDPSQYARRASYSWNRGASRKQQRGVEARRRAFFGDAA